MNHRTEAAFIATDQKHYDKLGLSTTTIEQWEDGLRTDPEKKGSFEWWYFDSHLDDGAKLVITFFTKSADNPSAGAAPRIALDLDLPDGRTLNKELDFAPGSLTASTEGCDVTIAGNTFSGDLHTYRITVSLEEVSVDVTLTGETAAWRSGTGHTFFGSDDETFFAWLPAVPAGKVEATYIVDGKSTTTTGHGYHDHNWGNAPMLEVLNNWYWGRGAAGPYSFITAEMIAEKKYGNTPLPVFMLARDNEVIADDFTKVTFAKSNIHTDEETGKPVADDHSFTYTDGGSEYTVAYHREETILRNFFIDQVHGVKRLLAKLVGFDGCYLRFSGTVTCTHRESGEVVEKHTEPAIWELMFFGKDPEA